MKKRVISMLLGMLMILSVVLTGCSSGEDGDNIIDVSQSRASAVSYTHLDGYKRQPITASAAETSIMLPRMRTGSIIYRR